MALWDRWYRRAQAATVERDPVETKYMIATGITWLRVPVKVLARRTGRLRISAWANLRLWQLADCSQHHVRYPWPGQSVLVEQGFLRTDSAIYVKQANSPQGDRAT